MPQGDRAQAGTFQVSELQVGILVLPDPIPVSGTSLIEVDSVSSLSLDTSYSGISQIDVNSVGILEKDQSVVSTSNINISTDGPLSLDQSLVPREPDEINSQVSIDQVSSGQVGYYERIYPATSINIQSTPHLSLRSEMESTTDVEIASEGTIGVDVFIDGQTSEVEIISGGTIGIDRDILTTNQIELVTSGELEIIVLFTNESCLVGLVNTESNLVGVDGTESELVGIIKNCGIK